MGDALIIGGIKFNVWSIIFSGIMLALIGGAVTLGWTLVIATAVLAGRNDV